MKAKGVTAADAGFAGRGFAQLGRADLKPRVEIVLPDGRFASVRNITVGDLMCANAANGVETQAILAQRITLIDGKPVSMNEIIADDFENWQPIFTLISKQMERVMQLQGGIA